MSHVFSKETSWSPARGKNYKLFWFQQQQQQKYSFNNTLLNLFVKIIVLNTVKTNYFVIQ